MNRPSALSGRDRPEGLVGNHLHAFYLPVPDTKGNSLEFLRVWCLHGLTQREVNALMSVNALHWAGGRFPVRPILLHMSLEFPPPERSALAIADAFCASSVLAPKKGRPHSSAHKCLNYRSFAV